MLALLTGYWGSQILFVAARLGIADALARGAATPAALAKRNGAHAPSLHRLLRALGGMGVVAEDASGRFRLTALGKTLRSDAPQSLHHFALMIVDDYNWKAWAKLQYGVQTGQLPFEHAHGTFIFDYLRAHPEQDRTFSASMASISGPQNDAVAKAYDFNRLGTLVDVGGAHGHLLATVLRRHKRVRGVLYDQPQVVEAAGASGFITDRKVAARITTAGGNFFQTVPAGADAYMMKYIIHDWNDDQCETILRHCREAMAPDGRVLVIEHVITAGNKPDFGKMMDINMLALTGGQERTREQFKALFARAGLRLTRVVPTESPISIVEGVAA